MLKEVPASMVAVSTSSKIRDAAKSLNESCLKIVLVVDDRNRLVGTICDGDIRRGLLNGLDMDQCAMAIANKSPIFVKAASFPSQIRALMAASKIHQIPELDADDRVSCVHIWDDLDTPNQIDNKMIIMAGGLGSRLRPLTNDCPKPMLKIADAPILEHIILSARDSGFLNFVISLNYLGHIVREYFEDGSQFGVNIEYLTESEPLGTAGALSLLSEPGDLPIVVTNGDILTSIDYSALLDFHSKSGAFATLAVREHEWQNPFGVVTTKGVDLVEFDEKPMHRCYVNAGIYVLDPLSLNFLNESSSCSAPELLMKIKVAGEKVKVYAMHEHWLDIGRPDDLATAVNIVNTLRHLKI